MNSPPYVVTSKLVLYEAFQEENMKEERPQEDFVWKM